MHNASGAYLGRGGKNITVRWHSFAFYDKWHVVQLQINVKLAALSLPFLSSEAL